MEEKKILVTRSSMPEFEEYCEEIKDLWESHWLSNNGVKHQKLEEELEKYMNINSVTLFTNGHMALETIINSLDLKGEVITTPFTFVSTVHAITRNGLIPVFCDINPDTYTIDVDKIEELITEKTCAIVPVHVYGNVCDVERINEIAKKHNLKVIYDAAHAFGEEYKNKSIATYGDASMFSFHATKVFNTIEGGAVAMNDKILENKLNMLKNFGIKNDEEIAYVSSNSKMNEFQAAMGLCNLKHLPNEIKKRENIYKLYIELLSEIKGIKTNKIQENVKSNYAYFPIIIEDEYGLSRDELFDLLKEHNIYARKYFYPAINETECYKNSKEKTPIASDISKRVITLPMYADLEEKNIIRICKIIKNKK